MLTKLVGTLTLALIAVLTMVAPSMAAYTDGQVACYGIGATASGAEDPSTVYFDGELPGCVDGIGIRLGVPTASGSLVSGPWLYWSP